MIAALVIIFFLFIVVMVVAIDYQRCLNTARLIGPYIGIESDHICKKLHDHGTRCLRTLVL